MNRETKEAASRFCEKHELYGSSNICSLYATPLSEWSNKAFIAGAVWQKEQSVIPTDKEIEKNSKDYAYAMKNQLYTEKGQHPANTAWSLLSRGYTDGYKQALKDIGYE
jgi:hypothetical protein